MKYLYVNGQEMQGLSSSTVEELVFELGLPAPAILVEHNSRALHRKDWADTLLKSGDRIELLRIAAGG